MHINVSESCAKRDKKKKKKNRLDDTVTFYSHLFDGSIHFIKF